MDRSTLYFMSNAMEESGFEKIASITSSKETWDFGSDIQKGTTGLDKFDYKLLKKI